MVEVTSLGVLDTHAYSASRLLNSSSPYAFFNQFSEESRQSMLSSLSKKINLQGDKSRPASFPDRHY